MRFAAIAPLVVLTLTAACTEPFQARVARFQSLPAPSGQTFTIQSHDSRKAGGLEFATYANLVSQRLEAVGYRPAADPRAATLVVNFDYAVTMPRERIETRPGFGYGGLGYGGFGPWGYGGYGGFGYGGGFYGRGFGYGGFGYGGGFGPYGFGGFGDYPEVYSHTVYNSHVDLRINRAGDNVAVFEGRAETVANTNDLTRLVPNLITAIFTNFPGNNGQTVRVQVDAKHPDGVGRP
jgi:hypothetical protein